MQHETGGGAVVAGVQPLRQGADVDTLVVKLLDGLESLPEVPGQAVKPRNHHRIPGLRIPRSSLHEGRRIFRPDATSVKIRSSLRPLSLRIRRWVASPLSPSAWETLM